MNFFRVFLKNRLNENVTRYTLSKEESASIEPRHNLYFISEAEKKDGIDMGVYYITQIRRNDLDKTELLAAAIELQKEALWSRLTLEPVLYIRSFFEDNSPVTQFWRPLVS